MTIRSFGPAVEHQPDGTFSASCTYCIFRVHHTCTHADPSRQLPDPSLTPEWCPMLESMLRDVQDMAHGVTHPGDEDEK